MRATSLRSETLPLYQTRSALYEKHAHFGPRMETILAGNVLAARSRAIMREGGAGFGSAAVLSAKRRLHESDEAEGDGRRCRRRRCRRRRRRRQWWCGTRRLRCSRRLRCGQPSSQQGNETPSVRSHKKRGAEQAAKVDALMAVAGALASAVSAKMSPPVAAVGSVADNALAAVAAPRAAASAASNSQDLRELAGRFFYDDESVSVIVTVLRSFSIFSTHVLLKIREDRWNVMVRSAAHGVLDCAQENCVAGENHGFQAAVLTLIVLGRVQCRSREHRRHLRCYRCAASSDRSFPGARFATSCSSKYGDCCAGGISCHDRCFRSSRGRTITGCCSTTCYSGSRSTSSCPTLARSSRGCAVRAICSTCSR